VTPEQAALLRNVVQIIVDVGYAVRPRTRRAEQIDVLAHDPRLLNTAYKHQMTIYVMVVYGVKIDNARRMLYLARKQLRAMMTKDKGAE
jgi:hypothetical protein